MVVEDGEGWSFLFSSVDAIPRIFLRRSRFGRWLRTRARRRGSRCDRSAHRGRSRRLDSGRRRFDGLWLDGRPRGRGGEKKGGLLIARGGGGRWRPKRRRGGVGGRGEVPGGRGIIKRKKH